MKTKTRKVFEDLPLEIGKTYDLKWATPTRFKVMTDNKLRDKEGNIVGEKFQVTGIFEDKPELGICPLNTDRIIHDKIEVSVETICPHCSKGITT